eukprot:evm.model.NODE_115_length_3460_cov_26.111561.2
MFHHAKSRAYRLQEQRQSKEKGGGKEEGKEGSLKLKVILEENPKWRLLRDVLTEIQQDHETKLALMKKNEEKEEKKEEGGEEKKKKASSSSSSTFSSPSISKHGKDDEEETEDEVGTPLPPPPSSSSSSLLPSSRPKVLVLVRDQHTCNSLWTYLRRGGRALLMSRFKHYLKQRFPHLTSSSSSSSNSYSVAAAAAAGGGGKSGKWKGKGKYTRGGGRGGGGWGRTGGGAVSGKASLALQERQLLMQELERMMKEEKEEGGEARPKKKKRLQQKIKRVEGENLGMEESEEECKEEGGGFDDVSGWEEDGDSSDEEGEEEGEEDGNDEKGDSENGKGRKQKKMGPPVAVAAELKEGAAAAAAATTKGGRGGGKASRGGKGVRRRGGRGEEAAATTTTHGKEKVKVLRKRKRAWQGRRGGEKNKYKMAQDLFDRMGGSSGSSSSGDEGKEGEGGKERGKGKWGQVFIITYGQAYTNMNLLDEVAPDVVVLYDPDAQFVREVEVHQARRPMSETLKVYFTVYEKSVEEQRYLSALTREKEAFERLVQEKKHMVMPTTLYETPLPTPGSYIDKLVADTRLVTRGPSSLPSSSSSSSCLQVVVDIREFRSSLPNLLHNGGMAILPLTLTIGDFVLTPEIVIERKSVSDLFGSFGSGRLYGQVENMLRHYKVATLLIEFQDDKSFSMQAPGDIGDDIQQSNIISKMVLLTLKFPALRILWSRNPHQTVLLFK